MKQYLQSTGAAEGAVPAEILQAATRVHEAHAKVQHAGPSDAVVSDDDEADAAGTTSQSSTSHVEGCAAVVSGGTKYGPGPGACTAGGRGTGACVGKLLDIAILT